MQNNAAPDQFLAMALKKSELYASLWKSCDELRGGLDLALALYGQEMDSATSALTRMKMVLHDCTTAEIW